MSKFVCLSREADTLVDEVEAEICQAYRGATHTTGKNLKPGNFFSPGVRNGGRKMQCSSDILTPMVRRETWLTKKLCNYEEGPCEERAYLLVWYILQTTDC